MINKKYQRGFGIIEVILLVGMLTAMTYFLLAQQQKFNQKKTRSAFDHEMNNVVALVNQVLSDQHNCTATVLSQATRSVGILGPTGGPVPLPGIPMKGEANGGELNQIILGTANVLTWPSSNFSDMSTSAGVVVFRANQEIYPGFEIGNINLLNDRVNDFIRIQFKYTAAKQDKIKGIRTLNRDFIIETKKNMRSVLECRLQTPIDILAEGCTKIGTWDSNLNFCNVPNYFLKSRDLYPLFSDGNDGLTHVSPIAAPGEVRCVCPTSLCRINNRNCCTPSTCLGTYTALTEQTFLTQDPPSQDPVAGVCNFTSKCLARPDAGILK